MKVIELGINQTTFDNAVELSKQEKEEKVYLFDLIRALKKLNNEHPNCSCVFERDKMTGMMTLTLSSDRDGKYYSYGFTGDKSLSSTTSE